MTEIDHALSAEPVNPPALLTPVQARILGVLVEKQRTVADSYPLTLNSLVTGCNQKSARDPVMELQEPELLDALADLRRRAIVVESFGASGRTMRYEQNLGRYLKVPEQSLVILAVLMLRGPQTPGELRQNCERMYRFGDISSVEAFLDELAERSAGALTVKLPREPGNRESRWAHLLCGEVKTDSRAGAGFTDGSGAASGADTALVTRLLDEVAQLRARVLRLETELGMSSDVTSDTHPSAE